VGSLDGRVAVVTGGNGIGAAIARRFAREGAKLVINDLGTTPDGVGGDDGPARKVAEEIIAAGVRPSTILVTSPIRPRASGWSPRPSMFSASSTSSSTSPALCVTG
jgi:NAD(P)-dependent dehydrogenase (short-subunit alcohol dehydrogenase family)